MHPSIKSDSDSIWLPAALNLFVIIFQIFIYFHFGVGSDTNRGKPPWPVSPQGTLNRCLFIFRKIM